jgi:hypothetical protein
MIVLRALGAMLSYPRDEVWQALPEISEAIRTSQLIASPQREELLSLVDELRASDLLEVEERYVDLSIAGVRRRSICSSTCMATGATAGRPWSISSAFMSTPATNSRRASCRIICRLFSNISVAAISRRRASFWAIAPTFCGGSANRLSLAAAATRPCLRRCWSWPAKNRSTLRQYRGLWSETKVSIGTGWSSPPSAQNHWRR